MADPLISYEGAGSGGGGGTSNVNVAQVNGTTISVNSGVADAGTIRVVPAANVSTGQNGQTTLTSTGVVQQLTSISQILQNGLLLGYTSVTGSGTGYYGYSTNVTTSTGKKIASGANLSVNPGVNLNTIYINGTAGDVFDWEGN